MPECTVYTYDTQKRAFGKPFGKSKEGPGNSLCAEQQAIRELGSQTGTFLFVLSDFPCSNCHQAFLNFKTEARAVIVSVLGEKTSQVGYESEHPAIVIPQGTVASSSAPTSSVAAPVAASSSTATPPQKEKLHKTSRSGFKISVAAPKASTSNASSNNTNSGLQPAWGSNTNKLKYFFGAKTYANGSKERYQTLIYYQDNPAYWIINGPHTNATSILSSTEFAILCKLEIKELYQAANLGLLKLTKEKKKKNN